MNPCVRFAPMLDARPGELSSAEARALADHLATCAPCQARRADAEALSAMLAEGLLAEANRRDFSAFSDGVLARIPAYQPEPAPLSRLAVWARRHRSAAVAGVVAPTLAALALFVYLSGGAPQHAPLEISAEGRNTMVLETSEGPVVLFEEQERS